MRANDTTYCRKKRLRREPEEGQRHGLPLEEMAKIPAQRLSRAVSQGLCHHLSVFSCMEHRHQHAAPNASQAAPWSQTRRIPQPHVYAHNVGGWMGEPVRHLPMHEDHSHETSRGTCLDVSPLLGVTLTHDMATESRTRVHALNPDGGMVHRCLLPHALPCLSNPSFFLNNICPFSQEWR